MSEREDTTPFEAEFSPRELDEMESRRTLRLDIDAAISDLAVDDLQKVLDYTRKIVGTEKK